MRNFITTLSACVLALAMGFLVGVLKISIEYKFTLIILLSLILFVTIRRQSKKFSEIESCVFTVFLLAALLVTSFLGDVREGVVSLYTYVIMFTFALGVVYLVQNVRNKRKLSSKS